jgi:hypothetical protein
MKIPELLSEKNSSLTDAGLQHTWDSTSLGAFKNCPRKYYYQIIHGWRSRGESIHLKFGLVYHSALEEYDQHIAAGDTFASAQRAAVRNVLESCYDKETNIYWDGHGDRNKNTETLLRAVIWYTEHFKDDILSTVILANGRAAVELSFTMESGYQWGDMEIMLCGHLDRVVDMGGALYILDRKTTKNSISDHFYAPFFIDNQISLYSWAGTTVLDRPVSGVMIDAMQTAVGFSRFDRAIIKKSKPILEEWHQDLGYWLNNAAGCAEEQQWPMNDKSCFLCDFKQVCRKPPSLRQAELETHFHQLVWDPLERR